MVPARKQLLDGNVQLLRRVLKFADDDDRASEGFRFTAPVTHHVALRAWRALSRGDRAAAEATARLPSVADHVLAAGYTSVHYKCTQIMQAIHGGSGNVSH